VTRGCYGGWLLQRRRLRRRRRRNRSPYSVHLGLPRPPECNGDELIACQKCPETVNETDGEEEGGRDGRTDGPTMARFARQSASELAVGIRMTSDRIEAAVDDHTQAEDRPTDHPVRFW
jgi:hypothetical protein